LGGLGSAPAVLVRDARAGPGRSRCPGGGRPAVLVVHGSPVLRVAHPDAGGRGGGRGRGGSAGSADRLRVLGQGADPRDRARRGVRGRVGGSGGSVRRGGTPGGPPGAVRTHDRAPHGVRAGTCAWARSTCRTRTGTASAR
jgi:hypothetical protein